MDDAHALPDDLDKCHQLLLAAFIQATELERVLDETAASYEALQAAHQAALEELSALKRWIYGRRTEKIVEGVGQSHLFDLEPSAFAESEAPAHEQPQHEAALPRRRRRRELDLAKLPHYRHEHDVSEADKQCSCCGRPKDRIGQDESKVLEYVPAKLEVHIHVRPKYACRYCQDGVVSPPPPARPIARGIAGPGLVAQILVAKFGDHLPLYRQEDFFTRHGLHIPRSTAPGTIDGAGNFVRLGNDDPNADFRNSSGYILSGPEYLTVFSGETGAELTTIPFEPARGSVSQWGDNYGNRVDRFLAAIAYLDGMRPSLIMARGYYGPQSASGQARNEIVAYNFRGGELTKLCHFRAGYNINGDINRNYVGQGNHNLSIADVDGDGRDEIIYGAAAIDDNGLGLYSTGLGHGDALHVSDMLPSRPGLEVFQPHESPSSYGRAGGEFRDARTGQLIFGIPANNDVGRGVAFDIDPNYAGYEMWATSDDPQGSPRMIYSANGQPIYATPGNMFYNFGVWWDADPLRELLDGTTISDWNYTTRGRQNLVSSTTGSAGSFNNTSGLSSNNGSKSTPALSADILGDWREEVIWRRSDNSALQIWTTATPAVNRIYTLMHDPKYRLDVAWQNVAYNQPPHPGFFLGAGMAPPPIAPIYTVQFANLVGDYNANGNVDAADYVVWRKANGSMTALHADGSKNGVVDEEDYALWRANVGRTDAPLIVSNAAQSTTERAAVATLAEFQSTVFTSRPFDQDGQPYRNPPVRSMALQRVELIAAILNVHRDNEGDLNFTPAKRNASVIEEGWSRILAVVDAAFDLGTYTRLEPENFCFTATKKYYATDSRPN